MAIPGTASRSANHSERTILVGQIDGVREGGHDRCVRPTGFIDHPTWRARPVCPAPWTRASSAQERATIPGAARILSHGIPEDCSSWSSDSPDLPSLQSRSGDGLDGRRRIGATPAEGDAGSADTPREPRQVSPATQPDEGVDPALGEEHDRPPADASPGRRRRLHPAIERGSPQQRPGTPLHRSPYIGGDACVPLRLHRGSSPRTHTDPLRAEGHRPPLPSAPPRKRDSAARGRGAYSGDRPDRADPTREMGELDRE